MCFVSSFSQLTSQNIFTTALDRGKASSLTWSQDRHHRDFWEHEPVHLLSSACKFSSSLASLTDKTKPLRTEKSYILTVCKRLCTEDHYEVVFHGVISNPLFTNRVEAIKYSVKASKPQLGRQTQHRVLVTSTVCKCQASAKHPRKTI